MKLIFTSYTSSPEYHQPEDWLARIKGYTGILEGLSKNHVVMGIERISYKGEYKLNNVQYHFIRQKKKLSRFPFRLHQLMRQLQPDVVFINGLIFPLQIIQLRLALGGKVKIILLHRAERPFTGIKRYLQQLADKCVAAYLFTSSGFSDEWKRNINVHKIHEVIQASSVFYPMDKAAARKIINIKENTVFLWVGMLIARKGPLTVVNAFLEFARHQPGSKLYMIYQSDELLDEIKAVLSDSPYKDSIILVGRISHDQLLYWYNSADFFISTSHYEGSGVAVAEAMSCGCIPIVSDFISFKKMTGPEKCGLIFEAGNDKALAALLLQAMQLDWESEKEKTLQQFKEELSFEAIAKKIGKIITDL